MKFSTGQLNKFRKIYLDCYGVSLTQQEAETEFREVTDLIRTIIKINNK
jgi:hypothetical protein